MSPSTSASGRVAAPGTVAVADGLPDGAGRQAHRHLGLALVVIATAQLMVVLDATIVNVALPHIQGALGFSGSGLEWVVNAYALTFGGLLLLGGRAGDLLGRRKVFIAGVLLFSAASLAGGFATTQAWLLAARAVQGAGAAVTAPTALSLVTTSFPEGPPRNRAMGVYAAMSVTGGVVGLIAGGLLTTYASWRWVLFVNVPIGIAVALAAPRVLGETRGHRGRFDLPGAITGTGGLAALVYGLSNAATSPDGVSHWGDTKVVASLAAAVVLLAAFAAAEMRSPHALLPPRLLRSRDRSGAYLIMLCVGTAPGCAGRSRKPRSPGRGSLRAWPCLGPTGYGSKAAASGARTSEHSFSPTTGLILMRYDAGLIRADASFSQALDSGRQTGFADQYMCMTPLFDVSSDRYAWLTQSLFIARGRLAGPKRIEYELYRVL